MRRTPRTFVAFAGILLAALAAVPAAAQTESEVPDSSRIEADTTWDDTEAAWRELEESRPEDFEFDELIGTYSHGWFPRANRASSLSFFGEFLYADVHDRGDGLRSRSFVTTTGPFTWRDPFESDERDIMEANSDEEESDGYPVTSYTEYGLRYLYHFPMPAIARADLSLQITDGILYSLDTTRSYLTLSGHKRPVREVGVVHLDQYALAGSIGLQIPVYGAFVESEIMTIGSYYYLHLGASAAYSIASYGTQYVQIASPKTDLRYGNGADTVTLRRDVRFEDLNRWRTAWELGVGWAVGAEFGIFTFEAFISIPRSNVLKDAPWRQYFVGFRTSLGYQWE